MGPATRRKVGTIALTVAIAAGLIAAALKIQVVARLFGLD
jgi:hypothetical protein